MKTTQRNGKAAFTLIELMAVITIIVILAALIVGGLSFVTDRQAKERAKIQMSLISKALEDYKLDMGTYPPTTNSATGIGNSKELYIALFYEGYEYAKTGSPTTWVKTVGGKEFPKATKIYLPDMDPTAGKQGWVDAVTGANPVPPASTKIKDPWGTEYAYRTATDPQGNVNPDTQNPDFDLWSFGKNAKSNVLKTHKDSLDDIWNP